MITISILGLDVFVAEHISRDSQNAVAKLLGIKPEEIMFFSSESYLFYKGVEQTSWNALVHVNAPSSAEKFQKELANFLIQALRKHVLNVSIEFNYYQPKQRVDFIDSNYPRFITESNAVTPKPINSDNEEEIFQDDIFDGIREKLEATEECSCCKDGICEGEENKCSCQDGKCECDEDCEHETKSK
jgi:hypothetical protein